MRLEVKVSVEDEVVRSPGFLREVVESAPVAMIMVDREGLVVLVNAEAEGLFGYPRSELLGESIERLLPTRFRQAHPSLRRAFFEAPEAREMGVGRELFGLRKDGSEFPIEIGLRPISAGGNRFVLSAIVNISQRRLLESRFRATVESSPTAMVMVDQTGEIVLVNAETEKLFGYTRLELLGAPIETLVPHRFRSSHPQLRGGFRMLPEARRMGAGRDLYALRKDGSEFPVEIGLNPVTTEEGLFVLSAIVDITDRKRNAHDLQVALREKTILLNEIHHRVKNNLQIISGLLQLQASQCNLPEVRQLLAQSESRVRSMAILHELLYEGRDFSHIRLDNYFRRLAQLLWTSYLGEHGEVNLISNLDPVSIDLNRAIPAGILVNELLTNCLKHARARTVTLTLNYDPQTDIVVTSVSDDGVGLPPGFELESQKSLGMTLATQLAEQVGSRLQVVPTNSGACFRWEYVLTQEVQL